IDSVAFEIAINHGNGVSAHLGGACLMMVGNDCIPDEVFQCRPFQVSRQQLALGERTKGIGVSYLATELHAGYRGLQVVRVGQVVGLDLERIKGIGPRLAESYLDSLAVRGLRTSPKNLLVD